MSNHYHLVLKVNCAKHWDKKRVLMHWSSLCEILLLCRRFLNDEHLSKAELDMVYLQPDDYRKKLTGDYYALVDSTGRCIVANKKGFIADDLPDILDRLNLNSDT